MKRGATFFFISYFLTHFEESAGEANVTEYSWQISREIK